MKSFPQLARAVRGFCGYGPLLARCLHELFSVASPPEEKRRMITLSRMLLSPSNPLVPTMDKEKKSTLCRARLVLTPCGVQAND